MSPLALALALAAGALPATLSLDEALAIAAERQPALRQARAGAEGSTSRARQALAPVLPSVSMSLGYSRSTTNFALRPGSTPTDVGGATVSLDSVDYWSGNLSAQGTLWDFGQTWSRYQASLSSADAAAAQLHAAQVAAGLQVRSAFYTALAQRELVQVAKATLANTAAHLAQVQGFVSVGARPEIDLAQSRADHANARLTLVNANNAYAVARARLALAMGFEGPTSWEVVGDGGGPVEGEDAPVEQLAAEALKARPEVAGLQAQVRAQELILRSTRAAYYPSLGASLGVTLGARSLTQPVPNVSGQLTLSWQLYQGGLTTAQLSEGEATLRQLAAQRDGLMLQVRLDVDQAELGVHAARESVEVAAEALEAAKERLRLAEGRYKAGAGSAIELGDAQTAYTSAAAQQVQAVYSLATARAQLLAALGRH